VSTQELFSQLQKLSTEQRNPFSMDIDARSTTDILTIINSEDKKVALAVETQIPFIASAVELVVNSFFEWRTIDLCRSRHERQGRRGRCK
jgi:N-acetylmuramic acid 6-phosphate etherase